MPRVFNHMIVMAQLGGERYWLDATLTFQRGTLERIDNPTLHWGQVTGQAADTLTAIRSGKEARQSIQVKYRFTVQDYRKPVALTVTQSATIGVALPGNRAAWRG